MLYLLKGVSLIIILSLAMIALVSANKSEQEFYDDLHFLKIRRIVAISCIIVFCSSSLGIWAIHKNCYAERQLISQKEIVNYETNQKYLFYQYDEEGVIFKKKIPRNKVTVTEANQDKKMIFEYKVLYRSNLNSVLQKILIFGVLPKQTIEYEIKT